MNRIHDKDHYMTDLKAAHLQALQLLDNLKHEVKIKIGLVAGKEIVIEKTELLPDVNILEYFLNTVQNAQEAIDHNTAISLNSDESTFINMRNLIMVLKEIRLELIYYKLGLTDIRKIYEEELPKLEAAINLDALTQHQQFHKLSSCRRTLRQIKQELASFNEKLSVLEAVVDF